MTINRFQRIGIVLSVLWLLATSLYQRVALHEILNTLGLWLKASLGNLLIASAISILVAWLLVFVAIKLYGWVMQGSL